MLKLVVLFALSAVVLARPGLHHSGVYSAPSYGTVAVHEPAYAHIGSLIKTVPSAVSHQSHSIVHSSAHLVEDVLAPAVKSTLYSTKSLVAPTYKIYDNPVYIKTVAAPVAYKSYAVEAPAYYKAW